MCVLLISVSVGTVHALFDQHKFGFYMYTGHCMRHLPDGLCGLLNEML